MKYIAAALSDKGNIRKENQDSICVKISDTEHHGQVVMAIICDGMGGYAKGELASATVVRRFSRWFEEELPFLINHYKWKEIGNDWEKMLSSQNRSIMAYGQSTGIKLGTTFTGLLILDGTFMIMHVGDTRIYKVSESITQVTSDHTLVAREVARGNLNKDEARIDKRRNVLLQCVGASKTMIPDIVYGNVAVGDAFLLCSDGLYNTIDEEKIHFMALCEQENTIGSLRGICEQLICLAKSNGERDNISAAMIKCIKE